MEITSITFILISIIVVFIYYLINQKTRVLFLTIVSCGFIATYSYKLLVYIFIYTLINYYIGLRIPDSRRKKALFRAGVIINITQLVLLKYVSFSIGPLFDLLGLNVDFYALSRFIIPIGVSYFTLQGIGYLTNVNLGWEKPERGFLPFLLYMVFYPRFISGPVDRSIRFLSQLQIRQSFDRENVTEGARLVLFGLFKKIVLANQLSPIVNDAFTTGNMTGDTNLWLVLFIQPLYLYFDFSGYTDIAIGFARAFGLRLPINFNRPFLAENVSTFWKRFHVSLSSWFHDYIFMRILFRRRKWKKNATNFALLITWILFGIWHGAGWNFILLGLLQALAIYYEFLSKRLRAKVFSSLPDFPGKWLGRMITYVFYSISLVFFFAPDIRSAFSFFSRLSQNILKLPGSIREQSFIMVVISILAVMGLEIIREDYSRISNGIERVWGSTKRANMLFRWFVYYLLIVLIIIFSNGEWRSGVCIS